MKKLLIILLVLFTFSCKKKEDVQPAATPAPAYTTTNGWKETSGEIGYLFQMINIYTQYPARVEYVNFGIPSFDYYIYDCTSTGFKNRTVSGGIITKFTGTYQGSDVITITYRRYSTADTVDYDTSTAETAIYHRY